MTEHHDRSAESAVPTREYVLRAMAKNYKPGNSWDRLDAEACIQAADEIKALREANEIWVALHGPAPCIPTDAQATQEPVAWQWRAPLSGKWYTDDTPDDPKVQKRLKDEGYQFRPLYASQPSPAATVEGSEPLVCSKCEEVVAAAVALPASDRRSSAGRGSVCCYCDAPLACEKCGHEQPDDTSAQPQVMRETLRYYVTQYCEGWCKDAPPNANFEDCSGCRARLTLLLYEGD